MAKKRTQVKLFRFRVRWTEAGKPRHYATNDKQAALAKFTTLAFKGYRPSWTDRAGTIEPPHYLNDARNNKYAGHQQGG